MTKQTKIFVSLVLCCTFLFLLVIPTFGADEPSEGNQMIIPSGTYTWNNTITELPDYWDVNIPFTVKGSFVLTDDDIIYDPNTDMIGYSIGSSPSGTTSSYLIFYGWDGLLGWVYTPETKWDTLYYIALDTGIDKPELKQFGRTFTITEDTSVPQDFGEWLLVSTSSDNDPSYEGNPFTDIMNLIIEALDVPIFGTFSLWDMLTTVCGLFAVVWLLKLLAGG